jgi:hypothetical protein
VGPLGRGAIVKLTVTDPDQLTYPVPMVIDGHFALFQDNILLVEGTEYSLGPEPGEITLSTNPRVGDVLDFRRL